MNLEVHVLQNFALSNLNRDEANAPKECEFGGVRRIRLSSQCLKRAIRQEVAADGADPSRYGGPALELAVRTRRITRLMRERLVARGVDESFAHAIADAAIRALGLRLHADETEYLLFLAPSEVDRLADVALTHRYLLLGRSPEEESPPEGNETPQAEASPPRRRGGRGRRAEVAAELAAVLDGGRAVDLALFGRMIADLPKQRMDAACQVAHAFSVHRAVAEFDFFSALDDLSSGTGARASRIDSRTLTSACFYRYQNLSLDIVAERLHLAAESEAELACRFLRACVHAIPSGRQSASAAQNLPSFSLVVLRRQGFWSLANAFETPIRADEATGGVLDRAIAALGEHWEAVVRAYGGDDVAGAWVVSLVPSASGALDAFRVASFREVNDGIRRCLVP